MPTHCLVPYAGSGMPFEKYVTDATDGGVQGFKLQGNGGDDKTPECGREGIGKQI